MSTIQVRRGLKQNMPATAAMGEFLFATDTGELFIGIDTGIVQIGFTDNMLETLQQILTELKASRLALVHLATGGKPAKEEDFEPENSDEEKA